MQRLIWLRHETKAFEQRCCLTPSACKELLELGHDVVVESSATRVYEDSEYSEVGCKIVETNSWVNAPLNAIIVGLKELEDANFPLSHRHIHFAHVFKNQHGFEKTLSRFVAGDGLLFDLEYLVNKDEKRIAAFGVWAGFAGAALGLDLWVHTQLGMNYNSRAPLLPYENQMHLINDVQDRLNKIISRPRVLIIGAKGRSGKGAVKFLRALGIEPTQWGSADTASEHPIEDILGYDILINCALIKEPRAPFLDLETIKKQRNLTVISDVGCDPNGPCNPLPIYKDCTTMDMPSIKILDDLHLTAIDHLPSLLPRESSEDFCSQLLPHFKEFLEGNIEDTPWDKALEVFYTKTHNIELDESIADEESSAKILM
ncbi:hypothetical protein BIY24_04920 [Halobacteriovorax marinus]|uniref:Saccharopine dehydrogenase [NAD(+), L-lysine-forming] n=1 Tax=Halobacteriovorax marinus (strain ATCC BAA-682 / DSM 15412 / SJ) TaxID=862908 RepID=E1WXW9_HALMS|nr:saccharopine dehydrogenase [Halobacteriovorax marinus]ATH07301.1 hypothetical protein BIY24_04920 [Halobacteriovorax marinus]CBW25926.1 putative alanine dehydrogenase [Halobacteriovorax marinus SJ]